MTSKLFWSSRLFVILVISCVAALSLSRPVAAQSAGTGSLTGTVTDSSGAVVPNVSVTATSQAIGKSYVATTGTDGAYRFSLLPPGKYNVKFEANGFKTVQSQAAVVNVTETTVVNETLQVGTETQTVTVEATTPIVNTASSTLGTLVSGNTITTLPLTNRNYTQVLDLSAGVSAPVNDAALLGKGTQLTSVNGANPSQNNYEMDGVSINNAGNLGNGRDQSVAAGIGIPNPDAIEEFKVQTSMYDASYGQNPGANVNVVTKSGGNEFHGDAFEFFRNTALNSNDFFVGKTILDQNQFGGVLGGPIKKNKLFFFGSYQGTRSKNGITSQGVTSGVTLPNIPNEPRNTAQFANDLANATCGAFTFGPTVQGPSAACGANQGPENISPVALAVLNLAAPSGNGYYIPTPSTNPGCAPNGYGAYSCTFSDPARYSENQYIVNVDYLLNSSETLQTRYFYTRNPQLVTLNGYLPGEPQTNFYSNHNAVIRLSSILSNSLTNQVTIAFQRNLGLNTDTPPAGSAPADLGMTPAFAGEKYPPGIWTLVDGVHLFDAFSPGHEITNQFQYGDQIAWTHGAHTIRAGFDYQRVQYNVTAGAARGFFLIGTFEDFLVGGPGNIYLNLSNLGRAANGEQLHSYRVNNSDAFVQDDWKVNSRLTLNLGLRWEFDGNLHDKYGNLTNIWPSLLASVPVPTAPTGSAANYTGYVVPNNYTTRYGNPALPAGVLKTGTGYSLSSHPPYSNFAPRIGFAWQPTHSSNLAIRGGFGLFYDRVWYDAFVHGFQGNSPYGVSLNYGPGNSFTLQNPFPNLPANTFLQRYSSLACAPDGTGCTGTSSLLNTNFLSKTVHTPLVRQYSLNVEYEFAPKWMLEVGYVGTSGINLMDVYRNYNTAQLATPTNPIHGQTANTLTNVNLRVPYLGYQPGGLQGTDFVGSSNYNSLQLTLRKQFSHGLRMQASYTWSKSLSDLVPDAATGGYLGANSNNPQDLRQQYGPSFFNRPQRLSVNYQYDLQISQRPGITGKLVNGWSVAGVTTVQDGNPLTLTDATAGTIYGIPNARAELCPGNIPLKNPGSIESQIAANTGYLNSSALCKPPSGGIYGNDGGTGFGNSGVGLVLGPGQFNWDIALIKRTKVTESQSVLFRAEFYNAFNHPQFANPATAKGGNFGKITSTSVNPRLIQFALKYTF